MAQASPLLTFCTVTSASPVLQGKYCPLVKAQQKASDCMDVMRQHLKRVLQSPEMLTHHRSSYVGVCIPICSSFVWVSLRDLLQSSACDRLINRLTRQCLTSASLQTTSLKCGSGSKKRKRSECEVDIDVANCVSLVTRKINDELKELTSSHSINQPGPLVIHIAFIPVLPNTASIDYMSCGYLIRMQNIRQGLITANALVSTLGGGHFMCAQLKEARRLAKTQLQIALRLGNPHLAARCKIHLAYSDIRSGHLRSAFKTFHQHISVGRALDDENLVEMCLAGKHYIKTLYRLLLTHGTSPTNASNTAEGSSALNPSRLPDYINLQLPPRPNTPILQDEYYRQRIVT